MNRKQLTCFVASVLVISVSTSLPKALLGNHYIFSAQMITHVLLLLVAAPLFVLSIPADNYFQHPLKKISALLQRWAFICWFTGVGIMWFWHIPVIFHLMQTHSMQHTSHSVPFLGIAHALSLWFAGIVFSWVVIGPYARYRIPPLTGILYLTTACAGCSLLGLLITFAPDGVYNTMPAAAPAGEWDIIRTTDQQMAGLIMWVPCCFIYLAGVLYLIKQWLYEKDDNTTPELTL